MNPRDELQRLLKQYKFALVGQNRHYKFQNPQGKLYVCAKTPSDWNAWRNALSTLKRVIAQPQPLSLVIEEAQQRKALEQFDALNAQRKKTQASRAKAKAQATARRTARGSTTTTC
jgi:hypothetical protein